MEAQESNHGDRAREKQAAERLAEKDKELNEAQEEVDRLAKAGYSQKGTTLRNLITMLEFRKAAATEAKDALQKVRQAAREEAAEAEAELVDHERVVDARAPQWSRSRSSLPLAVKAEAANMETEPEAMRPAARAEVAPRIESRLAVLASDKQGFFLPGARWTRAAWSSMRMATR